MGAPVTARLLCIILETPYRRPWVYWLPVHPTFLYESLWNIFFLVIFLCLFKKRRFDGSWFNQAGDQVFDYAPGRLSSSTAYVMVATVEGNSLTGFAKDKDGNNIGLANFVATKK